MRGLLGVVGLRRCLLASPGPRPHVPDLPLVGRRVVLSCRDQYVAARRVVCCTSASPGRAHVADHPERCGDDAVEGGASTSVINWVSVYSMISAISPSRISKIQQ